MSFVCFFAKQYKTNICGKYNGTLFVMIEVISGRGERVGEI